MNEQGLQRLIMAFVKALETGNLLFLDKYLSADVIYARSNPRPIEVQGKEEVVARIEPFLRAFSGWLLNAQDVNADVERQRVTCSLDISGANRGEMDFRPMGQGKYEATGRAFALPPGHLMLTTRGAQIRRIDIGFAEGGGLVGIFEQIGPHR